MAMEQKCRYLYPLLAIFVRAQTISFFEISVHLFPGVHLSTRSLFSHLCRIFFHFNPTSVYICTPLSFIFLYVSHFSRTRPVIPSHPTPSSHSLLSVCLLAPHSHHTPSLISSVPILCCHYILSVHLRCTPTSTSTSIPRSLFTVYRRCHLRIPIPIPISTLLRSSYYLLFVCSFCFYILS